jgi:hypothetical protein
MAESYYEKRKRILKEQKKRAKQRELARKKTIGPEEDIVKLRKAKKRMNVTPKPISGVQKRFDKSKSRLNPSVIYTKTPKPPTTKNITKSALGARNRPTPKAPTTLNITDTALGARKPQKTKTPTSFGAAFKAARKRLGAGKTFTWKGKKYSTNTKEDLAKKQKILPKPRPSTKKKIDPFAIKSTTKKKVTKKGGSKGKFTEPVDRKKKSKKKNVMSTKDIKYYKGTNITPTKLQRDRMRKRKLAST